MHSITIDPNDREIVTVFRPMADGYSVEEIVGEKQNVTIQRAPDGRVFAMRWDSFGHTLNSFQHQFGLHMAYRVTV